MHSQKSVDIRLILLQSRDRAPYWLEKIFTMEDNGRIDYFHFYVFTYFIIHIFPRTLHDHGIWLSQLHSQ